MNKPAGFLTSFFGSCCGTAVFFRLMHHSWGRVIWHSILISLICGIAVGLSAFSELRNNAALLKSSFVSTFGNKVLIGQKTIVPKENPEIPRCAFLPVGGSLIYTGTGKGMSVEKIKPSFATVIWRPSDLTILPWNGGDGLRGDFGSGKITRLTGVKLQECLHNGSYSREEERTMDFSTVLTTLLFLLRIYYIVSSILWLLLTSWLYTGIFALVFRIFHASRLQVLTISSLWKCGIYAGFPPLAVAALWQVLELPFIKYETVYMIGLLIYWMVVIAQIERHPNSGENNSDERA